MQRARIRWSSRFASWGLLVLLATAATAQEWTRFRGPNGSGISERYEFPATWDAGDYRWQVELPGIGHSSPVVWGKQVFITSADPKTATQYVLCFDIESGRKLWERSFKSQPYHLHSRASFACATPVVDAERLYLAWASPQAVILKALDHQGQEVWTRDLGSFISQHGFGSSPILFENLLIFSNSQQEVRIPEGKQPGKSSIVALDRRTGKTVWQLPRRSVRTCYTVPCIYHNAKGQAELIGFNTGDGFFSIDPRTGKQNWVVPGLFRMRTVSSPIEAGGLLFGSTGSGGGGNYVVAIDPEPTPRERYRIAKQAPYVPTPVARGELVFLFSDKGIGTCLDAKTGKTHWVKRLDAAFSGSPVRVRDKIYCIAESGEVVVIAAEPRFKELGRVPLGQRSRATPAVAQGVMLLRTYSKLMCLPGRTIPATARRDHRND